MPFLVITSSKNYPVFSTEALAQSWIRFCQEDNYLLQEIPLHASGLYLEPGKTIDWWDDLARVYMWITTAHFDPDPPTLTHR